MFWTFLALSLWVVLGGFISYYGDIQGSRWGKKRVSWRGLRPRHTASLITILTGGFIALLSIVTLMLLVPNVRDVILRGESSIQENKRLISEQHQERLQNQRDRESFLADSKRLHEQQIRQANADQQALAQGRRQLQQEQAKLHPLEDRVQALQAKIDSLQTEVVTLQTKGKTLQTNNARLKQENDNVAAINVTLNGQNYKLVADNLEMEKKNKTLQSSSTELQQKNERLKSINDTLTNVNVEVNQRNIALKTEIDEKQETVEGLKQDLANLIQNRDNLRMEISQFKQNISELTVLYSNLRQGQVKLRAGVELSRQAIDAHLRPEAVKRELLALMSRAEEVARSHGATPDKDGHTALLLPQKKVTLTGYEMVDDENAQIDALADKWSGNDVAIVMVASTVTNCLEGEPVYIELHPYRVVRVYQKGEVVASRQIDGHAPNDKIINELIAFLQKDVTAAALKNGTIPKVDPETGENEVSVLGLADLFNLLERVRRIHGPVLLTAKAKRDLSSADPLNLTFHVARVKVEPPQTASLP